MVKKDNKQIIYESFEDRKSAIVVGILCLLYFFLSYLPETSWLGKILPLWPLKVLGGIAAVTLLIQIMVWKIFRHFYPRWYQHLAGVILFISEFSLLLFSILFFTWPLYWVIQIFTKKHH